MVVCQYCGVRFLDVSGLINDIPTLQDIGINVGKVIGHQTMESGAVCPRAKKPAAAPAAAPSPVQKAAVKTKTATKTKGVAKSTAAAKKTKTPKSTAIAQKTIQKRSSVGKGVSVAKKPSSKILDTYLRAAGLSTAGTNGLKTSRLLEGVKDGTVKVGDLKALAKELGVPSSGSGDVVRPSGVKALGALST
jgi:hypothetical protein